MPYQRRLRHHHFIRWCIGGRGGRRLGGCRCSRCVRVVGWYHGMDVLVVCVCFIDHQKRSQRVSVNGGWRSRGVVSTQGTLLKRVLALSKVAFCGWVSKI
jgi:hypothetical protein